MRTTITLADDVAAALEDLQRTTGRGVSEVANDVLRKGLTAQVPAERFQQRTSDMGVPLLPLDDVSALLDALEGDDRRS